MARPNYGFLRVLGSVIVDFNSVGDYSISIPADVLSYAPTLLFVVNPSAEIMVAQSGLFTAPLASGVAIIPFAGAGSLYGYPGRVNLNGSPGNIEILPDILFSNRILYVNVQVPEGEPLTGNVVVAGYDFTGF